MSSILLGRKHLSRNDLEVLQGSKEGLFHSNDVNNIGFMGNRRHYLFHTFIFGEIYRDGFANQQFAENILELLGNNIKQHPVLLEKVVEDLNDVSNHMYSDAFTSSSAAGMLEDMYLGAYGIFSVDSVKAQHYKMKSLECFNLWMDSLNHIHRRNVARKEGIRKGLYSPIPYSDAAELVVEDEVTADNDSVNEAFIGII